VFLSATLVFSELHVWVSVHLPVVLDPLFSSQFQYSWNEITGRIRRNQTGVFLLSCSPGLESQMKAHMDRMQLNFRQCLRPRHRWGTRFVWISHGVRRLPRLRATTDVAIGAPKSPGRRCTDHRIGERNPQHKKKGRLRRKTIAGYLVRHRWLSKTSRIGNAKFEITRGYMNIFPPFLLLSPLFFITFHYSSYSKYLFKYIIL
jgi:hypothetical protein